ncbi:MAG: prepilin-type N-terminal cleavage/methylation domain-containing protein [Candidatus Omnitrophica bacterium]|nr:prepilin-type N-terminal cleavage/methylation domain-containing protein [Candidatus Omnitrophota bacterium]
MKRKGQTLLELMVAAVILTLVVGGITSVFLSAKQFILHSRSRMAAAELSRTMVDYLHMHVRADTWDTLSSNDLTSSGGGFRYCDDDGTHTQQSECLSQAERTLNTIVYSANYSISDAPANPGLRKVVTKITWNETTF